MKVVGVCSLLLPFLLVLMDTPTTSQSPVPDLDSDCRDGMGIMTSWFRCTLGQGVVLLPQALEDMRLITSEKKESRSRMLSEHSVETGK